MSSHTSDRPDADTAATYRALLRAVCEGRVNAARTASTDLLAGGAPELSVYRIVARGVLPRATSAPRRSGAPPLDALAAVMSLYKILPSDEAQVLLNRATGWAAGATPVGPVGAMAPQTLLWMASTTPPAWDAAEWGERVRTAAARGAGAAAEWALSLLLAGPDRGTLPIQRTRQIAYAALFAASAEHANAEHANTAWGRLMVTAQYAMEMADLLSPTLTFIALRPALWAIARAASQRGARAGAVQWRDLSDISDVACALRWNRREARPGETAEWARALRAGPRFRAIEEALASGLSATSLLDAAILAALAPAGTSTGTMVPGGLSRPAGRVVLALHAARRAHALADHPTTAVLATLGLLERLPRLPQVRLARRESAAPAPSVTAIARAAAHRATPPAILFGAAIAGEYADARQRAPDYAALLLRAAAPWCGLPARGEVAPSATPTHRAS